MNIIKIGSFLKEALKDITTNIYPLVAENGTNFPYVIYERTGMGYTSCKDGIYQQNADITIKVVTATYHNGVEMASDITDHLTKNTFTWDDQTRITVELTGGNESWNEEAYIQTIYLKINLN